MALISLKDLDQWTLAAGVELSGEDIQLEAQFTAGLKLALNYDKLDGNRYDVDETGEHDAILFRGDAQIDTTFKQFNVASCLLDGTTDGVEVLDGLSDFEIGAGNFTIHTWVRYADVPFANTRVILNLGGGVAGWNTTNGHSFLLYTTPSTYNVDYNSGGVPTGLSAAGDGALVQNTQTHIALVNDAVNDTFRVFVGGVKKINTTAITIASISSLLSLLIGSSHAGGGAINFSFDGHIDATYVVPGVALWTDDFTPPTAPEGAFLDTNPTATMGQVTVGENIDQIPIAENNGAGSSITWDYNVGAGFVTGNTLAQLKTALIGTSPATLDLRANLVSDTAGQPSFNYNGQAIASSGAVCDYPTEADVRLNVDYDSGNLTGSAAIPGASDVRDGVAVDATTGTAAIPGASDVRENVPTDATVGNYVPAIEDNHALGDSYGSFGTEFTGTKALTPFALPVEVILEDSEILVFEGVD